MKKRVLIICNYFAPDNKISSIRLTKFAKYLTQEGYKVTVLTEKTDSEIEDSLLYREVKELPIYYAEEGIWCKRIESMYQKITKAYRNKRYEDVSGKRRYRINKDTGEKIFLPFELAYPILGSMDYLIRLMKQKSLFRSVKSWIKKNGREFDVCFSTYSGYFGHYCGLYLKKFNPRIRWIADFRDQVYNIKFNPPMTKGLARSFENKVYRNCDAIVSVSNGLINNVPEKYRGKAKCITNGFDLADRDKKTGAEKRPKFTFCHTGIMYGGLRRFNRLFEAVRELSEEGKLDLSEIEFHYAGSGFSVFEAQAAASELGAYCVNHGQIAHEDALKLQEESDILLVASWAFKDQNIGMLTGKVMEYMAVGRPIVTITDGDAESNELSELIREGNFGYAYDEFNREKDFAGLKNYLIKQYENFKAGKEPEYAPKKTVLDRFDYRNLTKQLIALIEK